MKRLFIITITTLFMAACAEDVDTNNTGSELITFCATEGGDFYNLEGEQYQAPFTRNLHLIPETTIPFTSQEGDESTNLVLVTKDEVGINMKKGTPKPSTYITRGATQSGSTLLAANATFNFSEYQGSTKQYHNGVATVATAATSNEATPAVYSTSNITTNKAWPKDAKTTAYTFYAWNTAANFSTTDGKSFSYDGTTSAPENYGDLITAKTAAVNYSQAGPTLVFRHALAAIVINTDASFQGTITKIKFNNIFLTGSLTAGDTNGFATSGLRTYKEYGNLSIEDGDNTIFGGNTTLMMVPQTHSSSSLEIEVTDKTAGSVSHKLTVSLSGSWVAGHTYTYTISTNQVASIALTYPQWELSTNANTKTYGPVENYVEATADYGFIGMYVIDNNNNVVVNNAKVKIINPVANGHTANAQLTSLENVPDLKDALDILSTSYSYYAYYPYSASTTDWVGATKVGDTWKVKDADASTANTAVTKATEAEEFFANLVKQWTPAATQNSEVLIRANDLQIGQGSIDANKKLNFAMTHKMSLAKFTLSSKTDVQKTRYYIYGPAAVADANYTWYDELVTVTNSKTFGDNKPFLHSSSSTYYYIAKSNKSTATTISASAETLGGTSKTAADHNSLTNAWSNSVPASSAANKYYDISPSAPTMAYIVYSGYTLQTGDVYYSDGSISSKTASLYTGKTTVGIIAYIGRDAYTENSYLNSKSHALVLSKRCESLTPGTYSWRYCNNNDYNNRVDIPNITNTSNNLTTAKNDASGYANTQTVKTFANNNTGYGYEGTGADRYYKKQFPAFYWAENNNLGYPTGKSTGWFLGSSGQWCKVFVGLGIVADANIKLNYDQRFAGLAGIQSLNTLIAKCGDDYQGFCTYFLTFSDAYYSYPAPTSTTIGVADLYWTSTEQGGGDSLDLGFYNWSNYSGSTSSYRYGNGSGIQFYENTGYYQVSHLKARGLLAF